MNQGFSRLVYAGNCRNLDVSNQRSRVRLSSVGSPPSKTAGTPRKLSGVPELNMKSQLADQPPAIALATGFAEPRKDRPLPHGKSYVPALVSLWRGKPVFWYVKRPAYSSSMLKTSVLYSRL